MPAAHDAMIERAARASARRAGRLRPVTGYTRDEALQDARIGAWRALRTGVHDEGMLALAGYRDILDARHARWSASRGGDREQPLPQEDDAALDEHTQSCTGAGLVAVAQMLRVIGRLATPRPRVAAMLIQGYTHREIAELHGVSESRVSQWRSDLWRAIAGCV